MNNHTMNFSLKFIYFVTIFCILSGCATPSEIRQTGFNRTVTVPGTPESVAHCVVGKLDDAFGTLSHLVRKNGEQYSVISRNHEQATGVIDFREIGVTIEAKIYFGPAVLRKDRFGDKYEQAINECANRK